MVLLRKKVHNVCFEIESDTCLTYSELDANLFNGLYSNNKYDNIVKIQTFSSELATDKIFTYIRHINSHIIIFIHRKIHSITINIRQMSNTKISFKQ